MRGAPGRLALGLMQITSGDTESVESEAAMFHVAEFVLLVKSALTKRGK